MDHAEELRSLSKDFDFFIGIDSDGCVFDSMEIKQKECFCPAFIKHFNLQAASRFAREAWLFTNLYSKTRGCNRFLAVQTTLKLIGEWDIFKARGINISNIPSLDKWIEEETKLGTPALKKIVEETGDEDLKKVLAWNNEVNERISDMVYGVPPFSMVEPTLNKMIKNADVIVVSQTPYEALKREWDEHNISKFVKYIAGQEAGTKAEHLDFATSGKYDKNKVLMIGDAPGDLAAAQKNGVLFFPIIPGDEENSWKKLHDESLDRFFSGTYEGDYQNSLLEEFDKALPTTPPWKK